MSGGHFDYFHYKIYSVIEELQQEIEENLNGYAEETLKNFKESIDYLEASAKLLHNIDYLFSADIGEDTFNARYKKLRSGFDG